MALSDTRKPETPFRPPLLRRAGALALLVSLAACSVGPEHRPPTAASLQLPQGYYAPGGGDARQTDPVRWWTQFNDPALDSLIARALEGNNDLAVAQARLRGARAALRGARGAQLPGLSGGGSVSRQDMVNGSGIEGTSFQAGLDAAWETDIFGGLRRSTEAARATAEGSAASLADVQRSLVAEVALRYLDARQAQARLAVARDNLAVQDNTLAIVNWRVQAGLVGDLDLQQAIAQRAQTAASIPTLEQNFHSAANQIAVLLGTAPGSVTAELSPARPIPLGPDNVETGLPADLLNRRPDLIAAERALAAETARIGVAEAQLYPALRLSGSLRSTSAGLGDLGQSIIGGLIGSVTAPIFQGGQIRAQIEQQQAGADAALATYRNAVLVALQDVENALVAIDRTKARETALATAETAARETVRLAELRYASGLVDFQTLLAAQQSLLTAQDSRTVARASRASASIQLFKALGGGWQAPATSQSGSK